jgi:LPS sulfotransferase NodH
LKALTEDRFSVERLGEMARQPVRTRSGAGTFVVLSTQRSGSTWMIDMLNSHSGVVAYSELFISGGRGFPKWGGATDIPLWEAYRQGHAGEPGERVLQRYLERIFEPRQDRAVGFKLMYEQERAYPGILRYLAAQGGSILHLVRCNVLDVLISRETAAARGLYHARDAHRLTPCRIRLDASSLVDRLTEQVSGVERARSRYRTLGLPLLEVCYEELCSRRADFSHVLSFLGVDPDAGSLSSTLKKMNPRSHRESIENYEEVREALGGTAFECFLD